MSIRARHGNVLVLATALVLGLTIVTLGVAQLVLSRMRNLSYLTSTGFAPYQARLAAEAGVNAILRTANSTPYMANTSFLPLAGNLFAASYATASYSVAATLLSPPGAPNGVRIASTGTVTISTALGYPSVTKALYADLASGSAWTIASMSDSP